MDSEELVSDTDDGVSDLFHLFGIRYRRLKPIHVEIPNEILTLIAEHCVEPYELNSSKFSPLSISENCLLHLTSIALTSRAFAGGIRTGLCRSFTGKLTIYSPRAARRLPGIMKRHNIEWLAHGVTELIVHATGKQPLGGIDYNLYHNVAIIELSYNNHDRYDEPGYIMNISSEDDFEDLAMWRAQEAKRLILRPGREKLLMDTMRVPHFRKKAQHS